MDYLEYHLLSCYADTEENENDLKHKFSYFKSQVKQRWAKPHKMKDIFLKNNYLWLQGTFEIPMLKSRQGRPSKSFKESSERTKRRKRIAEKRGASKILKDITNSPTRANKYKKAYSKPNEEIAPLTPLQALSMFVEADLTRRQYEIIRTTNKKFYLCYDLLLKAKQECYPPKETIRVTATCAESDLQSLIDHTITRLSNFLEEVLMTLNENERNSLKIIIKWGCDGSQQAEFKQKFDDDAESDANVFSSSLVPLQIVCGEENNQVVWQNPTPSSPRYCRPIRFRFVKETADVTKEEIRYVEETGKSLIVTEVNLNGLKFRFRHILKMTMVDGKVCNAATGTKSTSRSNIERFQ